MSMMEFGAREVMAKRRQKVVGQMTEGDIFSGGEKIWCPEDEISGLGCRWWKGHGVMG